MEYVAVVLVALIASALTFFTGFGLGTLLLPAFAWFLPVELAVAATAIVHLANNLFKVFLMGRQADPKVVLRFALPAALFAIPGAMLLNTVSYLPSLAEYSLWGHIYQITPVKLVVAFLMAVFALLELMPHFESMAFPIRFIPLGGALSGFFGGLSGHQGALRSAFLIRLGLTKEAFVGTVVVSAVLVDVSRLTVYGITFLGADILMLEQHNLIGPVLTACMAAFSGSFIGSRLLIKITLRHIQLMVGGLLVVYAIAMGMGII